MSKYYIPSVSKDGILTWTPSEPGMPAVEAALIIGPEGKIGIRGPQGIAGLPGVDGTVAFDRLTDAQITMLKGPQGPSGVYVGPNAPSNTEIQLWIDSDEAVSTTLATIDYVQSQIKAIAGFNLSDYYTKDEIDAFFAAWAAASGIPDSKGVIY